MIRISILRLKQRRNRQVRKPVTTILSRDNKKGQAQGLPLHSNCIDILPHPKGRRFSPVRMPNCAVNTIASRSSSYNRSHSGRCPAHSPTPVRWYLTGKETLAKRTCYNTLPSERGKTIADFTPANHFQYHVLLRWELYHVSPAISTVLD